MKTFTLRRVGVGPGVVLFECEHLLGAAPEIALIADARELEQLTIDAGRYRWMREAVRLRRAAPENEMALLDALIDQELRR